MKAEFVLAFGEIPCQRRTQKSERGKAAKKLAGILAPEKNLCRQHNWIPKELKTKIPGVLLNLILPLLLLLPLY